MRTRALIEGMNDLGYAAANVGERDLALGYDDFMGRTEQASFPFVSSNIVNRDTREPVFKPFVILELDVEGSDKPLSVGVLGAVRFNPVFQKTGPDGSDLVILPPLEAVKRYFREVRERSDVVVLMAAMHRDDAHIIAREVEGIDLILGAYGATYTTQLDTEGQTMISYAGNQGRRVGETRVFLNADRSIERTQPFMHNLTARYPTVAKVQDYVLDALRKIGRMKAAAEGGSGQSGGAGKNGAEAAGAS